MARILAEWEKNSELQMLRGQDEKDRQLTALAKRLEVNTLFIQLFFFFVHLFGRTVLST